MISISMSYSPSVSFQGVSEKLCLKWSLQQMSNIFTAWYPLDGSLGRTVQYILSFSENLL